MECTPSNQESSDKWYTLKKRTKAIIEKDAGMSMDEIRDSSFDEIDRKIEQKSGEPLVHSFEPGHMPRGNPNLMAGRTIKPGEADLYFKKVKQSFLTRLFKRISINIHGVR